jgi:threonine aldolase
VTVAVGATEGIATLAVCVSVDNKAMIWSFTADFRYTGGEIYRNRCLALKFLVYFFIDPRG